MVLITTSKLAKAYTRFEKEEGLKGGPRPWVVITRGIASASMNLSSAYQNRLGGWFYAFQHSAGIPYHSEPSRWYVPVV
jgi:hypothetical protein